MITTFSKKYDVNGDGVLDEANMAVHNMDQSGRGYLMPDERNLHDDARARSGGHS